VGALKPRTGHGPLEVLRDRGQVVVLIPLASGVERLVFTLTEHEARNLALTLSEVELPDACT
jgi:hypothetical protein